MPLILSLSLDPFFIFLIVSNVWCFYLLIIYPFLVTIEESIQFLYTISSAFVSCIYTCISYFFLLIWWLAKKKKKQYFSAEQINHGLCYHFWIHDRLVSYAKRKMKNKKLIISMNRRCNSENAQIHLLSLCRIGTKKFLIIINVKYRNDFRLAICVCARS